MPKVSKVDVYLTNPPQTLPIHYKGGQGFSVVGLPEDFHNLTNFPHTFDTEAALTNALPYAVRDYKKLKESTRIVIGYRISATLDLIRERKGDSWYGYMPGISPKVESDGAGCGLKFVYEVYEELSDPAHKTYRKLDPITLKPIKIHYYRLDKEVHIIPYSETRLQFFMGMEAAMQGLVKKMSDFFFSDEEKLLEKMDSRLKLM